MSPKYEITRIYYVFLCLNKILHSLVSRLLENQTCISRPLDTEFEDIKNMKIVHLCVSKIYKNFLGHSLVIKGDKVTRPKAARIGVHFGEPTKLYFFENLKD